MMEFEENEFDDLENGNGSDDAWMDESGDNEFTEESDNPLIPPLRMEEPTANIPQFDLAEDIMAAHRKTTSRNRTGPGQKPDNVSSESAKEFKTVLPPCEYDSIIADIVSRDIERIINS
ncbi:MAG: hypothetical protein PHF37_05330 [Phycisphaerae bacterium]|nr:hypothetical protein [Phycisphaerae bacterium]